MVSVTGGRLPASVLVAEPDEDMRLYLRSGLAGLAGEVREAEDGLAALASLAEHTADLVIAESRMARLDGLELLRVLAARGVPVLLIDGETAGEAWEAGAAAVLLKPFDHRQLRRAIQEALAAADAGLLAPRGAR